MGVKCKMCNEEMAVGEVGLCKRCENKMQQAEMASNLELGSMVIEDDNGYTN